MTEAVIVSTARSPIGRAGKGSLVDMRPDDLAAQMVRAALDKVPSLDPREIDDLMMGCGQPGGEAGFNRPALVARRAVALGERDALACRGLLERRDDPVVGLLGRRVGDERQLRGRQLGPVPGRGRRGATLAVLSAGAGDDRQGSGEQLSRQRDPVKQGDG